MKMANERRGACRRMAFCFGVALVRLATAWGALEETIDFSGIADLEIGDSRTALRRVSAASGFFISSSGYVVTDRHRIADARHLFVVHDNRAYEARRIALSAAAPFALLKVDGGPSFPCTVIAQGTTCKAGDLMTLGGFAVSDEYGLTGKLTRGVISRVSKREYEVYISVLPEQSGAIAVNAHGLCEGMLLGVGEKKRNVNRVLNWKSVYADLPLAARTHLVLLSGRQMAGADMLELVRRCSVCVLAYGGRKGGSDGRSESKPAAGSGTVSDSKTKDEITIDDFNSLTPRATRRQTHWAGNGSGFFVTCDGYFVTNHHVVDGAEEIVVLWKRKPYLAEIVAKSKDGDLALLKVAGERFKPVRFSKEDAASVGQTVFTSGYPLIDKMGLEVKVTKGIVSSQTGYKGQEDQCQIDAPIQPGNSGGPVADERGNVIGVAVAKFRGADNVSYAIKMSSVKAFLPPGVVRALDFDEGGTMQFTDAVQSVVDASGIVLVYEKGAGRDASALTELPPENRRKRERELRRCLLSARLAKVHEDWKGVETWANAVLEVLPGHVEAKELYDLAQTRLGRHLVIRATLAGRDVNAQVIPVRGFKETFVQCEKPTALYDKDKADGFPVVARLIYQKDGRRYEGAVECVYNWTGTKELCVELHLAESANDAD